MNDPQRTPLTVVTGPLGSGKTTLLRHILSAVPQKLAILMNEFGEIAIDTKILQGKNVEMADLGGGCVCCSLLGEFEAAVDEIIATVNPDRIVVETTGVAEPDATRIQIQSADLILLNKVDLVSEAELEEIVHKLQSYNQVASIVQTVRCQVDPDLLFGIDRERLQPPPHHRHQPEFESFSYTSEAVCDRSCFETFADSLHPDIYRAKGFVRFPEGAYLFNFVAGRWDLEPFASCATELVFIGKQASQHRSSIGDRLRACEGV